VAGPLGAHVTGAHTRRVSLEGDDNSSDSGTDYAQDKNWNDINEVVDKVKHDDTVVCESDVQLVWCAVQMSYRGTKTSI
jgi:hypothetical protein